MMMGSQLSSNVLSHFPRFKDVTGLVEQDFVLMFGEDVSGKLLENWPTMFKEKIIKQCRKLPSTTDLETFYWLQILRRMTLVAQILTFLSSVHKANQSTPSLKKEIGRSLSLLRLHLLYQNIRSCYIEECYTINKKTKKSKKIKKHHSTFNI